MKNWKLAIVSLIFICLFISLGCWQLSRAKQKKILIQSYTQRMQQTFQANALQPSTDLRFYQARLEGEFDNQHTLLLDNKIMHGKVGYEVYTPFKVKQLATPILVDRGFIPMGTSRQTLPTIPAITGHTVITGLLNLPPTYVAFGQMLESPQMTWPLRVEFINLTELPRVLPYPLFNYTLSLAPHDPAAFETEWQIVTMGPEKHLGYAFQWFALALTLLILSVALNWKR